MTTQSGPSVEGRDLLALSRIVTRSLDLQTVLDESFAALRKLIDFDGGAIQLVEEGHLVAAATDPPAAPEALTVRIPVGAGVSGRIALTGEPIYIPDITVDERVHPEGRQKGLSGGVRSYFGAPLIERGTPIGVVQVDSTSVDAFSPEVRTLLLAFLPTITAAVQNARLFAQEQEALDRMQELEQLQRAFLSMISHELRTPLVSILGYANLLARGDAVGQDAVDFGGRIAQAGGRLTRLIDDVLEVSGVGGIAASPDSTPTAVRAVAEEAIAQVPEGHGRISLDGPDPGPAVPVDHDLLLRALASLLDNALRFSDGPVTVRIVGAADRVEVAVADVGPGIPPALHDRVFERFYQVDRGAGRRHDGLGIGLYLVRRLCERMAAAVHLDSDPGQGATFTLTIPRAPMPER